MLSLITGWKRASRLVFGVLLDYSLLPTVINFPTPIEAPKHASTSDILPPEGAKYRGVVQSGSSVEQSDADQ
jgi:hypothetical protein